MIGTYPYKNSQKLTIVESLVFRVPHKSGISYSFYQCIVESSNTIFYAILYQSFRVDTEMHLSLLSFATKLRNIFCYKKYAQVFYLIDILGKHFHTFRTSNFLYSYNITI